MIIKDLLLIYPSFINQKTEDFGILRDLNNRQSICELMETSTGLRLLSAMSACKAKLTDHSSLVWWQREGTASLLRARSVVILRDC